MTTPQPQPASQSEPLTQVADAIWVGVPLALRRFSAGLAVSAVDGLYLAVRPIAGILVPLGTFLAGFLTGAVQPGYTYVFTEALWLLLLAAAVGAMSGAAGLYLTLGFILGDLLFGEHPQWDRGWGQPDLLDVPAQYGSMFLSYALFAMLAIGVPIAAKSFAAEFKLPTGTARVVQAAVGLGILLGLTALLVWVWTQAAPLLVRPVFVWADTRPSVAAMFTSQEQGGWIVTVAVLATIARGYAQFQLAKPIGAAIPTASPAGRPDSDAPAGPDRMTALEDRFRTDVPVRPLTSRIPLWPRMIVRTAILTAVLAGLYAAWWQAFLTFAVLLGAQIITSPLVPLNLGPYAHLMEKVPRIVRLLIVMIPVYLLGAIIIPRFLRQESFLPFLVLAIIAAVLMSLLSPVTREDQRPPDAPTAGKGGQQ